MRSVLISPPIGPEPELASCDNNIIGIGGVPHDPYYDPHDNSHLDPDRWSTPLSAYRLITFLAIAWIVTLFVTLTLILESRWVQSKDWISIPLPHILYVNTAILLLSSLTIEFARFSLRAERRKHCIRWMFATLALGLAFIGGQIIAWRELAFRGLHIASNPGSFFLYLITGAHGLHLLCGIAALTCVGLFVSRMKQKVRQQEAVDVVALYWHFMDGLWIYLLALLFMTIQR